ncbi:hypothetical protein L1987_37718 [Smallanthus sonchifolius]|uniref:Uncharacterized protein n=1 Tax=Smallanthus sonchifolius TaxID=185202 RepID=A0ACB9HGX4_9ASTR|nr:hypothetical protein L1987_37718 [Smallanthus sonchifolius]
MFLVALSILHEKRLSYRHILRFVDFLKIPHIELLLAAVKASWISQPLCLNVNQRGLNTGYWTIFHSAVGEKCHDVQAKFDCCWLSWSKL